VNTIFDKIVEFKEIKRYDNQPIADLNSMTMLANGVDFGGIDSYSGKLVLCNGNLFQNTYFRCFVYELYINASVSKLTSVEYIKDSSDPNNCVLTSFLVSVYKVFIAPCWQVPGSQQVVNQTLSQIDIETDKMLDKDYIS
jgi:hypothetical protein